MGVDGNAQGDDLQHADDRMHNNVSHGDDEEQQRMHPAACFYGPVHGIEHILFFLGIKMKRREKICLHFFKKI